MRFDVRSLAMTCGILWAAGFFFIALAQQVWPEYGLAFLKVMDGLYPGYAPAGFGSVLIGTLYALVDGMICGGIFAWVYNRIRGPVLD